MSMVDRRARGAISITVIGRMSDISTGFAGAVQAEGWRWQEIPDIATLLAAPSSPRGVVVIPVTTMRATVYRQIRQLVALRDLPVIVICRACSPVVVRAVLRAGAEEVIGAPVALEEAIARLHAVIRVRFRLQGRASYLLNEASRTVTVATGATIRLSPQEVRLLGIFLSLPNQMITYRQLAMLLSQPLLAKEQRALRASIARLRRKLGANRLQLIRGVGCQLVDSPG